MVSYWPRSQHNMALVRLFVNGFLKLFIYKLISWFLFQKVTFENYKKLYLEFDVFPCNFKSNAITNISHSFFRNFQGYTPYSNIFARVKRITDLEGKEWNDINAHLLSYFLIYTKTKLFFFLIWKTQICDTRRF